MKGVDEIALSIDDASLLQGQPTTVSRYERLLLYWKVRLVRCHGRPNADLPAPPNLGPKAWVPPRSCTGDELIRRIGELQNQKWVWNRKLPPMLPVPPRSRQEIGTPCPRDPCRAGSVLMPSRSVVQMAERIGSASKQTAGGGGAKGTWARMPSVARSSARDGSNANSPRSACPCVSCGQSAKTNVIERTVTTTIFQIQLEIAHLRFSFRVRLVVGRGARRSLSS